MTGRELKRIRLQLGLTQKELAMRLGVQRNTVTRWEIGNRPVTRMIAYAIRGVAAEEGMLLKRRKGR